MRQTFKLAFQNLRGGGFRTWLSVFVLAFVLVVIVFFNGLLEGWNLQSKESSISWIYGEGQLWHKDLDLLDGNTSLDAYGHISLDSTSGLTPILIRPATFYAHGRAYIGSMRGIPSDQRQLLLPTGSLYSESNAQTIPVLIGHRMADELNVKEGDDFIIRWRDKNGLYDATTVRVAAIFSTIQYRADKGFVWMDLNLLQELCAMEEAVSYYILGDTFDKRALDNSNWVYHSLDDLLQPLMDFILMKRVVSYILFILFVLVALLAVFDTQLLAVFRRQKEIGIYISMGMTNRQVFMMFATEGLIYSLMAVVLAVVVGTPLLAYFAANGFYVAMNVDDLECTIPNLIYPIYPFRQTLQLILLMVVSATTVALIPLYKITRMNPVLSLKGKAL